MKMIFWTVLLFPPTVATATDLTLAVGEQKVYSSALLRPPFTVTNPKALKVTVEKGKVILMAKKPGFSAVYGRDKKSRLSVTVCSQKVYLHKKTLDEEISHIPALTYKIEPEIIIIKGTIYRYEDWLLLEKLQANNKKLLLLEVNPSPAISELIKVKSKSIELKPLIEIDILIAEIKKNNFSQWGLRLPGIYTASVIPSNRLDTFKTEFDPAYVGISADVGNSTGRVIANPKVLCRSGEKAQFLAGGEIPIRIITMKIQDVIWKKYGVVLNIEPQADLEGRISTKLTTEISLIDESHKIDGIPGMFTNRIETHFDLRHAQTMALSGLIKSEIGRAKSGPSLLSEIPILGELFKSHDYKNDRTELVIFVTPHLVLPEKIEEKPKMPAWMNEDL